MHSEVQKLWKTEDYWAVWLGLGIVLLALAVYTTGGTIAGWAVKPGSWSTIDGLVSDFTKHLPDYLIIFATFGTVFTIS
ncbi:MAG: putative sulfate exporter family transporter, partial [Acidobacteriota bacterium]